MSAAFRASAVIRQAAARIPAIVFPVRRLPDGTRVSDLPVGESPRIAATRVPSPSRVEHADLTPPFFPGRRLITPHQTTAAAQTKTYILHLTDGLN